MMTTYDRRTDAFVHAKILYLIQRGFQYFQREQVLVKNNLVVPVIEMATMNMEQLSKLNWAADRFFQCDGKNFISDLASCSFEDFLEHPIDDPDGFEVAYKHMITKLKEFQSN